MYLYACSACGRLREDIRCIAQRADGPTCDCGKQMDLQMTPVTGIVKNPAVPKESK